ncbi:MULTISPECIES: hypothetical protein [Rhodomicrobium]|uniref:hypothetical protein n=1 Tax=Rhodomicrobium TaxID=1068 RepID=UPI000B4BE92A|nr:MULTISPECIES: hypothetical protein [Rhodomicrobium]
MEQLFLSGRIVDLILALMLAEFAGLWIYTRRKGLGMEALGLVGYLLSGAFLLLALRVALTGGNWVWIAAFLLAAFAVHLADLRGRLTR